LTKIYIFNIFDCTGKYMDSELNVPLEIL